MTLRQFIRENREALDKAIQRVAPGAPQNDEERRLWVLNIAYNGHLAECPNCHEVFWLLMEKMTRACICGLEERG